MQMESLGNLESTWIVLAFTCAALATGYLVYIFLGFLYATAQFLAGRSFLAAVDTYRRNMDPEAFQ
jgi:hypothetical protein